MARPERILHFIPDRPGTGPRIEEAVRFAKTNSMMNCVGAEGRIPVFAKRGTMTGAMERGVRIVEIGDRDISTVSDAATLCSCAMRQNALKWSLRDNRDAEALSFLRKLVPAGNMASRKGANCDGPSSMDIDVDALNAESRANLVAMENAGSSLFRESRWGVSSEIREIIEQHSSCDQEAALAELLRIISQDIVGPISGTIQKVKMELVSEIRKSLSAFAKETGEDEEGCPKKEDLEGAILRIDRASKHILKLERIRMEVWEPFGIVDMTAETARVCSELKGLSYACGVAESEFRVAVMNVPWEGEATIGMLRILSATGIEVKERESFGKSLPGAKSPTLPSFPPPWNPQP